MIIRQFYTRQIEKNEQVEDKIIRVITFKDQIFFLLIPEMITLTTLYEYTILSWSKCVAEAISQACTSFV